jgi:hypothetical protein
MARITSLLEQTLGHLSGEGLSNQLITFITIHPEKRMGEQSQKPQYNTTFMQSTIPVSTLVVMDVFTNKPHRVKSSEDIDHDKITTLDARVRAIEGVNLYDHV